MPILHRKVSSATSLCKVVLSWFGWSATLSRLCCTLQHAHSLQPNVCVPRRFAQILVHSIIVACPLPALVHSRVAPAANLRSNFMGRARKLWRVSVCVHDGFAHKLSIARRNAINPRCKRVQLFLSHLCSAPHVMAKLRRTAVILHFLCLRWDVCAWSEIGSLILIKKNYVWWASYRSRNCIDA